MPIGHCQVEEAGNFVQQLNLVGKTTLSVGRCLLGEENIKLVGAPGGWVADQCKWVRLMHTPGCGQVFPVKVELVENDGVKHLNFGKERSVGCQLAPAGRATKEGETRFFLPVGKLLEHALNIFFGILWSHLRNAARPSKEDRPEEDVLWFSSVSIFQI